MNLVVLALVLPIRAVAEIPQHKIGLMSELSGSYALNGELCRAGYEIALEQFTGDVSGARQIAPIYGDSQGNAMIGINEFRKLTEVDRVIGVVSTRSQVGMALNPLSEQKQIALLGIVGHAEFTNQNPYAFRFWPTTAVEAPILARQAYRSGARKIAVLTLEDEWTLSFSEKFSAAFKQAGGALVLEETAAGSTNDWAPLALRAKSAGADSALVNFGSGGIGVLVKKLREVGFTGPLFSNYWAQNPGEISSAGAAIEGLTMVEIDFEHPKFLAAYARRGMKEPPTAVTYTCYSGLATLLTALKLNPEIDDSSALYAALRGLDRVELLDETLALIDREAQYRPVCKVIRGGRKERL